MRIECVIPFHSNTSLFYIWMYVCVVFVNERDKDSSTAELRFASQGLHCYMMYLFIFFHTRNNWFSFVLHSISSLEKFMTFGCSLLTMAVVVVYFFFNSRFDILILYAFHSVYIWYQFFRFIFTDESYASLPTNQTKLNALDHNFVNGSDINCVFLFS